MRRFLGDKSGAASIEFAFMAPLVFTALFGVMGVGWVYLERDNVSEAMRLGVRDVVVRKHDSIADIKTAFTSRLGQYDLDEAGLTVVMAEISGVAVARVSYNWSLDFAVPFVGKEILSGTQSMDIPIIE